ncbi:ECF RNA polymerase sigma factor SigK [Stackebrandtia nassauensis]|uniref:RNA polymerase, sigma-24 subunit, ECF subfamily n=1 Tax=Stackebrandtia nassauensis (strain DSM 44728 / CIP 108903 / NRRL B-16338 / NBRC 102104 / LLR-40K-21) TaxID=446470 RepID=D3Q000_STANL|nr:ECF RNA polymerase sigma factor SigK [Stackebrandtia nassauensis]ADD45529.1 RNA polymerase, sigma-24 subunit, ECF subfamily [Stackebrandtia nassauensis DSM 44728]
MSYGTGGASHRQEQPRSPFAPVPDNPISDEALLQRAALGDEDAFTVLYDRLSPRVYGLCLRVLRDPAQAEEVAQDVLVELWRTAARFDPSQGSALTWVATLTHRRAVDRVRSTQASRDREHRSAVSNVEPEYDQVAEAVAQRLDMRQLRRCLKTLTELQHQAVTMAYYGGHSYRQVANLLGAAVPTVKSRIRDGLIRLRDCLEVSR